jgi:hypothetical protein
VDISRTITSSAGIYITAEQRLIIEIPHSLRAKPYFRRRTDREEAATRSKYYTRKEISNPISKSHENGTKIPFEADDRGRIAFTPSARNCARGNLSSGKRQGRIKEWPKPARSLLFKGTSLKTTPYIPRSLSEVLIVDMLNKSDSLLGKKIIFNNIKI